GAGLDLAFQPSQTAHAVEQWIQCAGADSVAMAAQFIDGPQTINGALGGVVQDVDLPETQEDFAGNSLHAITYYENRYLEKSQMRDDRTAGLEDYRRLSADYDRRRELNHVRDTT